MDRSHDSVFVLYSMTEARPCELALTMRACTHTHTHTCIHILNVSVCACTHKDTCTTMRTYM